MLRKGASHTVTLAFLVGLAGCMGEASALPEELAIYTFGAAVKVNPTTPVAGRTMMLNVEITSHSNVYVTTDVVMRVLRADGSLVVERVFEKVSFNPEEIWNLTQSVLPGSDDLGALHVEVVVRKHETGEELWRTPEPTNFVVQ